MKHCKTLKASFILLANLLIIPITAFGQSYQVPPSSSTTSYVPVISDEKMEECVKLYNEATWLSQSLNSQVLNRYNAEEVNAYNLKVSQHRSMISKFNNECAGRQSRSACEAANRLNEENGIQTQKCN